jgi:S1-C subfamily serine protease
LKITGYGALMAAFMCHATVVNAEDDVAALREHAYQKTCLSIAEVVHESALGNEHTCGFFIDEQGTLVTVLGMLGEPGVLSVIYGDRKYETTLLTYDAYTRLALLKVEGVMAPAAVLGLSTNLDVGDHVFSRNAALPEESLGGRKILWVRLCRLR